MKKKQFNTHHIQTPVTDSQQTLSHFTLQSFAPLMSMVRCSNQHLFDVFDFKVTFFEC